MPCTLHRHSQCRAGLACRGGGERREDLGNWLTLVDPGANVLILSKSLADTLGLPLEPYSGTLTQVSGQVGTDYQVPGGLQLSFCAQHPLFGMHVSTVMVLVQDTASHDVIFGMSGLGPVGATACPISRRLLYAPLRVKHQQLMQLLQGTQASHLRWSLPLCTRSQHPRAALLAALSAQLAAPAASTLVDELPCSAGAAALPVEPLAGPLIAAVIELQPEPEPPLPVAEPPQPPQPPLPPWPPSDTLPEEWREVVDQYVRSTFDLLSEAILGAEVPAAAGEVLRDVLWPATSVADEHPARDAFMELLSPFDTLGGSGFDEVCVEAQLLPRLQQHVSADWQRATGAVAVEIERQFQALLGDQYAPGRTHMRPVKEMKAPLNQSALRTVLGFLSYYRCYVPDFSSMAQPLNSLLAGKAAWQWGPDQQQALEALKGEMCRPGKILRHLDPKRDILHTDCSIKGMGAVLGQVDDDGNVYMVACRSNI